MANGIQKNSVKIETFAEITLRLNWSQFEALKLLLKVEPTEEDLREIQLNKCERLRAAILSIPPAYEICQEFELPL